MNPAPTLKRLARNVLGYLLLHVPRMEFACRRSRGPAVPLSRLVLWSALLWGCSGAPVTTTDRIPCSIDTDCPGTAVCVGKFCADISERSRTSEEPAGEASTGPGETQPPDPQPSSGSPGGSTPVPAEPPPPPGVCAIERDNRVTRNEMPIVTDIQIVNRVNNPTTPAPVNLNGEKGAGGTAWDFSQDLPGDHTVKVWILSKKDRERDRWFAADFPSATYVTLLSEEKNVYGVFEAAPEAIYLLGTVSLDPKRILIVYSPKVPMIQFPVEVGKSWSIETMAEGVFEGVQVLIKESYRFEVDAQGAVSVPLGSFRAFRIRSTVEQKNLAGKLLVTRRVVSFLGECAGTIARVVSMDNESNDNFSQAREVWRADL